MHKRLFFLVFLICGMLRFAGAQSAEFASISEAISVGNAKDVAQYFTQTVELMIDNNSMAYDRASAEFILRNFFREHEPKRFAFVHKGNSNGKFFYAIGEYETGKKHYTILVRLKSSEIGYQIHEITISK